MNKLLLILLVVLMANPTFARGHGHGKHHTTHKHAFNKDRAVEGTGTQTLR